MVLRKVTTLQKRGNPYNHKYHSVIPRTITTKLVRPYTLNCTWKETRSIQREVHREAVADLHGLAALLAWDEFWKGLHHADGLVVQQRMNAAKDGDVDHRTVGVDDELHEHLARQAHFPRLLGVLGFRNHMLGQLLVSARFSLLSDELTATSPNGHLLHNVVDLGAVRRHGIWLGFRLRPERRSDKTSGRGQEDSAEEGCHVKRGFGAIPGGWPRW